MTRSIEITKAGPHTSVQDGGRRGVQWLGIPEGGALDRDALALGNALVGNPPDAAVLEICLGNFACVLRGETRIALTGSDAAILAIVLGDGGQTADVMLRAGRSVDLPPGSMVSLARIPDSNTATLAFAGGIASPEIHATRTGILLRDGDRLTLGEARHGATPQSILTQNPAPQISKNAPITIRCVRGPHDELFSDAAMQTFLTTPYKVTPAMSRMGLRLEGTALNHDAAAGGVVSTGVTCGAIQVPGDGQPIILLADHQTTGGYANIACVISADMPKLARLRPHDLIAFTEVTTAEAENLARDHAANLAAAIAAIKPAPPLAISGAIR